MTVLKQTAELDLLDMLLVYYTIHTGNFFERCSEVVGGGLFSGFATSENGTREIHSSTTTPLFHLLIKVSADVFDARRTNESGRHTSDDDLGFATCNLQPCETYDVLRVPGTTRSSFIHRFIHSLTHHGASTEYYGYYGYYR